MKKRDLVKRIAKAAKGAHVDWEFDRQGGNHEIYLLGQMIIPVPRHNEIGEGLAEDIFKECEPELGKGWWRK